MFTIEEKIDRLIQQKSSLAEELVNKETPRDLLKMDDEELLDLFALEKPMHINQEGPRS